MNKNYDHIHRTLGDRYDISPRTVQLIRSKYSQEYQGKDLIESIIAIRKEAEKDIVDLHRVLRPAKIAYAQKVLKDELSYGKTLHRIEQLQKDLPALTDLLNKVGEKMSLVNF